MYLKSLQLIGFKSFAEKTTLDFLPGVTAVVGPNGCGKSNIADAIRWVLGEQSAKALRGSEMADVIFSGTDGRRAIGMAEVSMTFADVDPKTLSMPGVNLDFSEITITRRVYRDGRGEYLINKTPCRLRDIQGLFMDTGIGRSSYSLMAQGQIDQILSAHPEDRRNIFEEAAGINKYKHQKKEALRKLEYTEANLVRITDIIKEVKRQIISLQRQAGKARRYKELFDQLKTLDTRLARHKFDELRTEMTALESEAASFSTKSQEFTSQIAEKEQQISDLRRSLSEIERAINSAVSRDHEQKSESDRHQQRIESHNERIAEFEEIIGNHHREIAGSEERISVQEQDLARLNAEFAQIDGTLAEEQSRLQAQQATLKQLDAELAQNNAGLSDTKAEMVDVENSIAHGRNELSALDHKKKHDVLRAERLSTERLDLQDQRRALEQRLASYHAGLVELRASVESLRAALAAHERELSAVSGSLSQAAQQLEATSTEHSRKGARLETLRQFFGAPDGRATLGHILDVEQHHGAAVEAALSHNIRTVLADDLAGARELLSGNHQNPSVASPDLRSGADAEAANGDVPTGAIAWATAVARVRDARFEPVVRSLLRNVCIAENLDAALAIRGAHPRLSVATQRGEFLSAHGILSAVSSSHIAEISALTDEVSQLQARVEEQSARTSDLAQQQEKISQELAGVRGELHAKEVALAAKEGECSAISTEERDLDSKIHTVVFELATIEQQETEEKRRRGEIIETMRKSEELLGEMDQQLAAAQKAVEELRVRREQMTQQLTEMRVAVGGTEHKREAIRAQLDPITGRIRDLRERMQTCAGEIAGYTSKIEQFRAEIAESEQKIVEMKSAREQSRLQLDGLQHQRDEVSTGIDHAEEELRAIRKEASQAQEQKSGVEVLLAQKRMELRNIKDRTWQKYQVNVEDVRGGSITITIADQGPATAEEVEMPKDWDAVETEVAELQSRLDAMGPVNVEAIHEYDELEQRYKFLTEQHEDLVKAKDQLLQVISRINTTTKQLFSETFEKVRENFQEVFTALFGGGRANLILLDENDPLESGIEIVAKPPGKQLQSITLLSGGERTLTATALLFSIYMVKPSPFCVLDELDAPLDESNINRFIRILQQFVTQSQFVIITHNKRTIGMADALYGITMEEHGVSKVVSVKFSQREEADRRALERAREEQEDRIDGAATTRGEVLPHEETLGNDLLEEKEKTVEPVADVNIPDVPRES